MSSSSNKTSPIVSFFTILIKFIRYSVGFFERFFPHLISIIKNISDKSKNWGSSIASWYEAKYGPKPGLGDNIAIVIMVIIFASNLLFPWLLIWAALKAI